MTDAEMLAAFFGSGLLVGLAARWFDLLVGVVRRS